ncbi:MAG: putative DNA binding domain-containing protein [Muribaculaceae bacterium]|nr:putative DNA binding domain-containing protein [Muribaculaceae bacterium]
MKKATKLSMPWFYELLERGECDIMDFKLQLEEKETFGKSLKNYSDSYDELARDAVAFANNKGGFLFIGIEDKSKTLNDKFVYDEPRLFKLIKQIQDRTRPSITLVPHKLTVNGIDLLVLEIPFTPFLCSTTKGEYLIRSNDGNRAIQPNEMATILSEKGSIVYDQKTWNLKNWQDKARVANLQNLIRLARPDSPYLKDNIDDFNDVLSLAKEEDDTILPTTTGILFTGTDKALREFPYAMIKYIRYFDNGTYRPYEWSGNLIEVADACFTQLKAEIQQVEMNFGLFHEVIEDYSEITLREVLINALAHRDYSRQQIIEIRKYSDYIEFESPGHFPEGITTTNFLWKTNPRNPDIIDIFRAIKYAEKAGSGWDKVFTELLSKGKAVPVAEESDTSVIFRIEAGVVSEKLIELSLHYQQLSNKQPAVEQLLILNELVRNKSCTIKQLERVPYINVRQIHKALQMLIDLEIVEATGSGSGTKYIIHKKHNVSIKDKVQYSQLKKQEKARQKEAILRYLDSCETINNAEARTLLVLPEKDRPYISRLLTSMVKEGLLEKESLISSSNSRYRRKKE